MISHACCCERHHEGDAVGRDAGFARHGIQNGCPRIDGGVDAMSQAGKPLLAPDATSSTMCRAAFSIETDSRLANSKPLAIISMHAIPAPPCSSPIARTPAAIAAENDWRLPDATNRAAAQTEPRRRDRQPRRVWRPAAAVRRVVGRRPRCNRKMESVNPACVISDVTS